VSSLSGSTPDRTNAHLTCLVLGCGKKRVGYHIARELTQKGYQTLLHYRSDHPERLEIDAELKQLGCAPHWFQAELSDEPSVERLFQAIDRLGLGIDSLVHAASIWKPLPWREIRASDLEENYKANLLGTVLPCLAAGKRMVRQENGGCMILLGDWAVRRPYPNYLAYFASKGAIPTITRGLAVELGQANPRVRVNCIEPGPVMLPPDLPQEEKDAAIQATLVKREGTPREVALAALSLIENTFVTGVCLPVDGGRSIWAPED